jgi:hypothetical protein
MKMLRLYASPDDESHYRYDRIPHEFIGRLASCEAALVHRPTIGRNLGVCAMPGWMGRWSASNTATPNHHLHVW